MDVTRLTLNINQTSIVQNDEHIAKSREILHIKST
jgi:hypothetical protein